MPVTPRTYLDLQIMFQDKYEASVKPLGLNWILSTDVIINYIYSAELETIHELATNKQYNLLKGYTTVSDVSSGLSGNIAATNVSETENLEFDYLIKSYSTVTATYPGVSSFSGVVENENILQEDAGIYYKSAFNIPYFKSPKIYIEPVNTYTGTEAAEKKLIVIVDGYTILEGLSITTIKLPEIPEPSTSCFIDYTLYNKIVEIAVNKAIIDLSKFSSSKNKES